MLTEIENYPEIVLFETSRTYRYLWLKYVKGFDLTQHCAKCLLGAYSNVFNAGKCNIKNAALNEDSAKYYYICGVTMPYRWHENLHIAFRYKADALLSYDDGMTRCIIRNAEEIPITTRTDYRKEICGRLPAYNTCRNWRFAYQMTHIMKEEENV